MAKSPQGFIVVLPGEIIEIAQDDDISWLTLFYALPKELAEKYPDALKIPRSPYEVLYEGSYGAVAKSDMLKMLVWDCYSWAAWQFFKVKDRKGNYREIPGSRSHYAGFFPLWRLSYAIIPYIRMKFEKCGLGFQNLYNMPKGVEVPWLTYQQFGNLVGNLTDKDREILQLRMQGHTEKEIAEKVGYQTASAVHKRIAHIANAYEDFVMGEYQNYLDNPKK